MNDAAFQPDSNIAQTSANNHPISFHRNARSQQQRDKIYDLYIAYFSSDCLQWHYRLPKQERLLLFQARLHGRSNTFASNGARKSLIMHNQCTHTQTHMENSKRYPSWHSMLFNISDACKMQIEWQIKPRPTVAKFRFAFCQKPSFRI